LGDAPAGDPELRELTAEGMTLFDADVIRVLEDEVPARFVGSPGDYQLVEDEGAKGRSRLRLLMHPGVGPFDPPVVIEAFLAGLGSGDDATRFMTQVWREAGLPTVERCVPRATRSGKVLHLHRSLERTV
jgi:hypothetical protein